MKCDMSDLKHRNSHKKNEEADWNLQEVNRDHPAAECGKAKSM
jgi:LAS superfamily LD-carboxypeptidase LdcB